MSADHPGGGAPCPAPNKNKPHNFIPSHFIRGKFPHTIPEREIDMNFAIETVADERALLSWTGVGVATVVGVAVGVLACD